MCATESVLQPFSSLYTFDFFFFSLGQCPFAVIQDTVGVDSNPSYLTAIDADECLDICSTYLRDGIECWAATWHATSRRCGLHYPASKSYYDDPANRDSVVGYTLYVKSCYSGMTNIISGLSFNTIWYY